MNLQFFKHHSDPHHRHIQPSLGGLSLISRGLFSVHVCVHCTAQSSVNDLTFDVRCGLMVVVVVMMKCVGSPNDVVRSGGCWW